MTVQLLTLKGTKYVLMMEKDFRRIQKQLQQDEGDLAQAARSKASGPARPYAELRKKLGLK